MSICHAPLERPITRNAFYTMYEFELGMLLACSIPINNMLLCRLLYLLVTLMLAHPAEITITVVIRIFKSILYFLGQRGTKTIQKYN